jgi:GT2 family glycosyltransferase
MVGPMLLLEDGRIQSAGHSNKPTPSHIGSGESGDAYGMWGMYMISRSLTGLTGACVAIRRSVYSELGGFSLDYPINFNDVDFCFKVLDAGYRIVWTPMARLYHFESMTRVLSVSEEEIGALERRWKRYFGSDIYSP